MSTLTRLRQTAALAMTLAALSACQAIQDPNGTEQAVNGVVNSGASDRAMSALTRGDAPGAERLAMTALRYNPRDPIALIVAGMAYQSMGRTDLAEQYYEVIITTNVPGSIMTPGDNGVMMPRSIMDIARTNLAALDKISGRYVPRSVAQSGAVGRPAAEGTPPLPLGNDVALTAAPERPQVLAGAMEPVVGASPGQPTQAEANAVGRFRTLKRLLDEGLVTPDEYRARRAANIGALLPYTSAPPSTGLDRPVPGEEAVVARLRALAQTLETRAITPSQQAAERGVILESLLPEKPRQVEVPARPPRDLLEAGQAVGRVERILATGLIGADEAAKEKAAINQRLGAALASQRVDGTVTGLRQAPLPAPAAPAPSSAGKATTWGVALASAASEADAKSAWGRIKAKFPQELGGFDASFKAVGGAKRYRVVAGPLADKAAATKLCKTLKLHRQSCDPASM